MTVVPLLDPRIHAAKARLRRLEALRRQVDTEILEARHALGIQVAAARKRRSRHDTPECGTEEAYQRHRYQWRKYQAGTWPLPEDDPCGCRAAHRRHQALEREEAS